MTTFKDFFPELLRNPSNSTFLVYADLLEEAGRDTQAALVRASLRLRADLTSTEQAVLGVSHPLDATAFGAALRAERDLQRQFIAELGPEIAAVLQNDASRISFERGVIERLDLYETSITSLPEGLQVGGDLCLERMQIAALPEGLQVGRSLYLYGTRITSLPEGLQVGGNLNLSGTSLPPEASARIPDMPGLSYAAKFYGLYSAGYRMLAYQVERNTQALQPIRS